MSTAASLPTGPPIDPGVEQARSWLAHELSSAAYADDRSPLQRFLDWLQEHQPGFDGQVPAPGWALPVVLVVLALVVVAILLVAVRRSPTVSRTGPGGGVLDEPRLTADGYRARAESALQRGDATAAAADAVRAVVAASAERTLLDDVPGRTAHEIGGVLAVVFPHEAGEVRIAADLFDRVVYGRATVVPDDARSVLDLDLRLRATRPVLTAVQSGRVTAAGASVGGAP
ncbi:DUF4129 domain-containing protein [Terrabacter aerolatus]|uniref:Protein-glutamine gamma-glutamyltransferase-like C-terminal domain-containing protein n=1 Tax=Terrabacter aerolatus TaxID=422442 RepID=A0A512D6W5_9MICO|nr:DUF4129 domain-containing protein [Terrabacter aerolatus]GEO32223.1 hypothetical protein TAE01_40330 [Terrabacter aerolatus]